MKEPVAGRKPAISVVVVVYNIPREAPRTLLSLSATYQRNIAPEDYEIIVVDNGSTPPFDPKLLDELSGDFRLIRMDPASASPAKAVNRGLSEARGDVIGVIVDGARIVTPGLLHFARNAASLYPFAVVASLGWYLGADIQRFALEAGYDQGAEDQLLQSIGWPQDGYRLFEIATPDEVSAEGWFQPIAESHALFLSRAFWDMLGGVDEQFDAPGGGLINRDTYNRALGSPGSELVVLLGEGTFQQIHGGTATHSPPEVFLERMELWRKQYEDIRGHSVRLLKKQPTYLGTLPHAALMQLTRAALHSFKGRPPLGQGFDHQLWTAAKPDKPADPQAAALVELAQTEFRGGRYAAMTGVARMARLRFPDEPEPQRLLSLAGASLVRREPPVPQPAYYTAIGEAHRILGDRPRSESALQAALALKEDFARAHIGLSQVRMPGVPYLHWLARFHELLSPKYYLEIGVHEGKSLGLARPPTHAIGVDPAPKIKTPFATDTFVFAATSDEFFAGGRLDELLRGQSVSLGFIDGLHVFQQALRDFINLERYCNSGSVVLMHDTYPIDEATQDPVQRTGFYTGDVWKTVVCIKQFRPDLDTFTIATPWSGLTVITGLDPKSRILSDNFDRAEEQFVNLRYSEVRDSLETALEVVPNSWPAVEKRLQARLRLTGNGKAAGSVQE